jgi:serine phosphatase RsbU (regulator of sigma subunit)
MGVGQEDLLEKDPVEEAGEVPPELLVVDDDPDILRIVQFFLSKQKYNVHVAADGQEALEVLAQHPQIELILSDVMMPRISGLDLLKEIRKHPDFSEIPVILISAEGETSQKVVGLNLGADDFITKPFNFDELMARVRNHLRLRRLQRDLLHANDLLKQQYEMLVADLETAKGVQLALMPDEFPQNPDYRLGSQYLPVDRLGGDLFDIVTLDNGNKLGVLIVDVCGHGVAAAFITAMTKITFRNACFDSVDPAAVLSQMNRELNLNLKQGYVTVFYGVYDIPSKTLAYASGGHPPLLVHRRCDNELIKLEAQATFLGIFESVRFASDTLEIKQGDRIIFYTDGLFESSNEQEDQFGMERVTQLIESNAKLEIQPLLDELLRQLRQYVGSAALEDDVTMVGLEILR